MFYILHGQDDFHRQEALQEIKRGLGNAEALAVDTVLLDGERLSFAQLKDACSAYPSLLCPARLVIVEGLLARFEPKAEQGRPGSRSRDDGGSALGEWRGLVDYVGQMPPTTVLVLVDGDINKKGGNRLLRPLAPAAKVRTFRRPQRKELQGWIQERVKRGGGTITPAAVSVLVDFVGGDLWAMSTEIEKLLTYTSDGGITEESVMQLTCAREANVFALMDAIFEGRTKIAQQLLQRLLHEGAAPPYILVMITRQLRLIVRARELGKGLSPSQIRDRLKLASDNIVGKLLKQARAYDSERIRRAYHKVLEADIAMKTGKYDGELALDLLVIELCRD